LDFVVTGGVEPTEENISAWFTSGVVGVGMGSKLISKAVLQNKNYDKLREDTTTIISIIGKIRKSLGR
jgi:2-dehydro-3-deoxyphosphogluconate aldolase / (4S)-4-hydroxy-2-oxoglutarate aldolase